MWIALKTGIVLSILLAGGLALRVWGLTGDLWLDEIWSLNISARLDSVLEVVYQQAPGPEPFDNAFVDNNHILNSWWMRFLGEDAPSWSYRLLSFLCGVALIPAVRSLALAGEPRARLILTAMIAISYPMILYSSEARGYVPMIFFGVVSLILLERRRSSPLFWITSILGQLAHPTFFSFQAVGVVSSLLQGNTRETLQKHTVPMFTLGMLFMFHYRFSPEGSGPLAPTIDKVISVLALIAGGPALIGDPPWLGAISLVCAVIACVTVISGLGYEAKQSVPTAAVLMVGILVAPMVMVGVMQPRVVFERYFLANIFFGYLVTARWWASASGCGPFKSATIAVFFSGSILIAGHFACYQRGSYRTITTLVGADRSVVTATQPFRTDTVMEYYGGRLGNVSESGCRNYRVETSDNPLWTPPAGISAVCRESGTPDGYQLITYTRSAMLSGFGWALYERILP